MFRSYRKLIISGLLASAAVTALYADTGASKTYAEGIEKGKKVIDGGVTYPVKNGKSGPYYVNEKAHSVVINNGRPATANEIKAWDIDVMPDGTGLPKGHGTAEEGEEVYEAKCLSCHGDFGSGGGGYPSLSKGNAYELHNTLKFQRVTPDSDGPVRVFGTYWPRASTLWWYIKTGMPHPAPLSLTDNQVYALCAYIYTLNELKLQDGTEIEDDTEINQDNVLKVDLPNKDGFIPKIDGPNGLENARKFYNDYSNYGNGTRCMHDCFKGEPKILPVQIEQKSFLPPLSEKRDLPKNPCWIASCDCEAGGSSANAEGKKIYEASCAVCHGNDSMGAPNLGNKEAWAKVMKQGMDTVLKNAINGKNAMPPRGGTDLPDEKLKAAIEYMYSKSK